MNGLFGTFGRGGGGYMMPQVQTPQQNVANYLRMPVAQAQPQQQQMPTMAQFLDAAYPKQENFFNTTAANPVLHVAGLPLNEPKPQPPSQEALMLQKISGYNNTTS